MAIINEKRAGIGNYVSSSKGITALGTTKVYGTISERDSDGAPGVFAFVRDASDDETVKAGFAIYYRKGDTWKKLFEEESMDQDIVEYYTINWSNVVDAPTKTPSEIDDAVEKAHEHENKELLDSLNLSNGVLSSDDTPVKAEPIRYTKYLQLVRPVSDKALDCRIIFYTDPDMTRIGCGGNAVMNSLSSAFRFKVFKYNRASEVSKFAGLDREGFGEDSEGRFVLVNIQKDPRDPFEIDPSETYFIRVVWYEHGDGNVLQTTKPVSKLLCVYPAITPTNSESVGFVWSEF